MKVLQIIRKEFIKNQPLKGIRVSACLHVTAETANLMIALRDGGADVALCASNPLSTQDDVAASLVRRLQHSRVRHQGRGQRFLLLAHHGRGRPSSADHHGRRRRPGFGSSIQSAQLKLAGVIGGTEETTTGVIRLRAMAKEGVLQYPIIAVNDADNQASLRQTATAPDNRRLTASSAPPTSAGRREVRRRRLRLVRTRPSEPGPRRWRRSKSSPRSIPRKRSKP